MCQFLHALLFPDIRQLTSALANSLSVVVSNVVVNPLTIAICILRRRGILEQRETLSNVVVAEKTGEHCYLEGKPVF